MTTHRRFVVVPLFAGALLVAAAGSAMLHGAAQARGASDHGASDHGAHRHESLPPGVPAEASLHHLDVLWTDHHGRSVRLADFAGQNLLITMFYGSCTTACPLLLHKARTLQDALPQRLDVLAVSFDPEADTPEAMRAYAEQRGYDRDGWHFLSGSPTEIRMLATLLGVRYQRRADGHYDHSNLIALLDERGVVRLRTEGVAPDVGDVLEAVAGGALEP
jgi:protein SCO1